ncbi:cell morphogenesis N-terminal-domain-containing protein [Truncatella angustata]|uniref:Cell morphogenesis N-terminal-domain-containing protein n=1 Tax=Truncatella angustata TaxID=152316 RepID=A0A9P9A419_9PEZI|nr:cell morphogenesis N-terminal-domain-containing protein [Truncatella angustata]KAH6659464.1 cell morphogenesis N-terminal-domain-containing protein [Truncatella angustata]
MLTTLSYYTAPSQALPEHIQQDTLRYSPRSILRLNLHDDDEATWDKAQRPFALDPPISRALSRPIVGGIAERAGDPKGLAYGHHRQTSIVHGFQHSRNGSLASSSSSPLSPQIIAAAGAGLLPERLDMHAAGRLESDSTMSSRPSTALSGSTATASVHPSLQRTLSTTESNSNTATTQKKLDRMQSKSRRDHSQQSSNPSRHQHEQKTVGEYALHVLFTHFIALAEEKLNECITIPFDPEPQIEHICGPGADPAFDQFIAALGHIASQKPKPLIDLIMLWRKQKSEAAGQARNQLQQSRGNMPGVPLLRRNTEPVHIATANGMPVENESSHGQTSLAAKQEYVAQAERRSIVSIYVLCRVLLEVISQSSLSSITQEMEGKLEAIIFGQLKIADIEQLFVSPLKLANWNLFSQLLGVMSGINFVSVTNRFIVDLERSLQDLTVRSPTVPNRDPEGQVELVLGGMKHLRLKVSPDTAWDQSCDFLIALGQQFARSHGQKVKSAFCQVLETLLLPIAGKASNSHLTHPKWSEVISNISPRLASMFIKPRHWQAAFPLTATMICMSPPETSASQWLQMILPLQTRLKDRNSRLVCLQVISRLLWAYLYRCSDTPSAVARKLDEVMKLVLPPNKRIYTAADTTVSGPLVQIIRIIGFRCPEYCFKNIIFPLVNAELFNTHTELKVEQLDPDRMVMGIRAFLVIMADLEKGEQGRPPFPLDYVSPPTTEQSIPVSPSTKSARGLPCSPLPPVSHDETLSKPVHVGALSDAVKEYYKKFSGILGKITIICDDTFGGQAALDEKFNSPGPKTPIAETFNFSRRDDNQNPAEQKQAFYELLHVAVQALPRCLPADIPFNSLINLLCTGTAHVQTNIAESSAQSLKSIARQSHAYQVTMGFARFIFNFDDRYSTMSDGGMLGPGHIENTLRLYVELLQIWRDEIKQKTKDAISDPNDKAINDKRGMKLDLSSIWAEVEHVEARGLFFLCSQSRRVRYYAVTVLRLITEFDSALGKDGGSENDTQRLIDILDNDSVHVMSFKDEHLSVAERSRLQRGIQKSNNRGALVELCTSDVSYDTTLWFKIFPNLIRIAYERCPFTVTISRDLVCNRIMQMYKGIVVLSEPTRGLYYGSEPGSARHTVRTPTTQPDVLVEQFKLYLIFACTTLVDTGPFPSAASRENQHGRKPSKSLDKIISARVLFKYLNPLLSVTSTSVREAVVVAMGSINKNIFRTLLEELSGQVSRCNDEARTRLHQRTASSPRRNRKMDLLRTELTHVYKLTSHFLKDADVFQDEWILNNLCVFTKDLKLFLMDGEVQMDWEFQKLRRHYCGLMEELFEGIARTKDPSRWMTFESRKSSFSLMEDWCGFSPNQSQIHQREESMRQSMIDQQSLSERGTVTAAMEIEKRNLRTAALSAMAALCAGPVSVTTESGAVLQFDMRRMLMWIESIFNSGSDRLNLIGRQALKNLIVSNQEFPYLLDVCIRACYTTTVSKVLESYFTVITEVLLENINYPTPFWRLLGLCLFALGNELSDIRSKSARVLRALEEHQQAARSSKIQDFDISISDKTKAVYKLAQFEISKRLAKQHPELAFHIFSEFALYFEGISNGAKQNMVAVILPWIQTIELKVDPNGGPIANSYVLLANLLELTIKSGSALHNEVQALWQALATGPHPGNVRLVLDFIISLCLERREQNFVEYAKQIVVFLSSSPTSPGIKVVEFLLMQITPKAMVPNEKRDIAPPPPDINHFPHCADLNQALPVGTKQAGFSLGQLSLILLVDLMVSPVQLSADSLPILLQVVTVLWDHYTPLVQEQAREMLVHLIHELVVSKMDDATPAETKNSIENVIDAVRRHDKIVVWGYEDSNGKTGDRDTKVPQSMEYLTSEVVKTFEVTFPGIKEQWSKLSLTWATSCPIFRCVLSSLDQLMLGDMLARLSNTIADEDSEIQTFSMEILTTLKTLIVKLEPEKLLELPQLFWTACACLESINEREFLEAVEMLNEYLDKLDFHDPVVRQALLDGRPPRWDGTFEGIQPLMYTGLRSSLCLEPTLKTLAKLVVLASDPLVGNDDRLFFAAIANFPRFLEAMDNNINDLSEDVFNTAEILYAVADAQDFHGICVALDNEFLWEFFTALRDVYLPQLDFKMLVMLMGFLTNSISSVKIMTMRILTIVIPETEMRRPEIAGHGSDLISPLLRLLQTHMMAMPGSSMDKHHLRMSMTQSSSKATRKEYERTQSLFGIPEESGWAVPVPAKKTDVTRANIHAAFYMCQTDAENGIPTDPTPTPDVEFHNDDFHYGYFQMPDRTDTMMSDEIRGEAQINADLVTKLDSLDDFFDDMSQSPPSEGRSSHTLYDEQILPILHQASSNTSFQNGFVDRPPPGPSPPFSAEPTLRPGLINRSITSPMVPTYSSQIGEVTSDDEFNEDVFSDGDDDRQNTDGSGDGNYNASQ